MGLSGLNNALTGLSLAQRQIDVISNNISNVGTEGYTRKILPQTAQIVDGKGAGVLGGTIIRSVDLGLSKTLWTQVSQISSDQVQAEYLERVEQFHGPPDANLSIASTVSDLSDQFLKLADDPSNPLALSAAVNQAVKAADKMNELSDYITTLRNDAQNEITTTVSKINDLLKQIANLNEDIVRNQNLGKTTAAAEDFRDQAVKELSGLIETTHYIQGDGTMVVQTNRGAELAGRTAQTLDFKATQLGPTFFYPDSAAAVYIGDRNDPSAVNLTDLSPGGKLGGLIELRDNTFQKHMAQIDELAYQMASRFEAQGLMLFTDQTGALPANTAPNTTTDPETAVPYVGFASVIQVNQAVINDHSLLQTGTEGVAESQQGANTVINRVIDHVFGNINYQQASGNISLNVSGNTDGQNYLSNLDLNAYANGTAFIASTGGAITNSTDTFRISVGAVNLDIDISNVPDGAGNFAQDIIDHINTNLIPALSGADQAALTAANTTFAVGSLGQLDITSDDTIAIDGTSPADPIGTANLALVGLDASTVIPNSTLQDYLGLRSTNRVESAQNLNIYDSPATYIAATNSAFDAAQGTFRITLADSDLGIDPVNIDIDLTAIADGAGGFTQDMVDHINTVIIPSLTPGQQTALTRMNAQFTVGNNGNLKITSEGDITIDGQNPANALGDNNLDLLGLSAGTTEAEDPYFDIAVGSNNFTRITISPSDTEVDLLNKLNAVPGLAARYGAGGELELRPGNDFTDPDFGGSLRLISSAFETNNAGANTVVGAGTVPDGLNVLSAMFGSFNAGSPAQDTSPIEDVFYGSSVSSTDSSTLGFREDFLGPGANVSTGIAASTSLADYAQRIVNEHTQETIALNNTIEDSETFTKLLQQQLDNESGVNMDQELSQLIVIQTAYSASARVVNAIQQLFDDLLAIF